MEPLENFGLLKARVEALIEANYRLRNEKKAAAEKLLTMQEEIYALREQCRRYRLQNQRACERISRLIRMLERLNTGSGNVRERKEDLGRPGES